MNAVASTAGLGAEVRLSRVRSALASAHWRVGRGSWTLLAVGASLLAAIVLDWLAPWPYVMTPLYVVPVLLAAHWWSLRAVGATAGVATLVNILAGLLQGTPLIILMLYTTGLLLTDYLAVALAWQRQETTRHAHQAEAAHRRLQEFMASVVHELRNPLTALRGYLRLLDRPADSSPKPYDQHALHIAEQATGRLQRLVDDLRDAARLGTDSFAVRPRRIDLAALAREVVALRQTTTDRHHLTLEAPDRVEGIWDGDRIAQLLANLVSNAIKYSPEGGEVRVTIRLTGAEVLISVADQGLGLSVEQQAQLFQPFVRLHSEQVAAGLGLGLAIAKGIVEAHAGRIWVESEPGQDSCFSVALPRAIVFLVGEERPLHARVSTALEQAGYVVHPTSDPSAVMRLVDQHELPPQWYVVILERLGQAHGDHVEYLRQLATRGLAASELRGTTLGPWWFAWTFGVGANPTVRDAQAGELGRLLQALPATPE
jgi:signal transduction histidine kinase